MEPQILVQTITIVVAVAGSALATVGLLLKQMNHLETKLETKIAGLDTKFTDKIDALDTKVTDKIDALDTKVTDKIDALDTKVTVLDTKVTALDTKITVLEGKIDTMGGDVADTRERLARVEGHLMAPQGFALRTPKPPATVDPPADDLGPDHRQAG